MDGAATARHHDSRFSSARLPPFSEAEEKKQVSANTALTWLFHGAPEMIRTSDARFRKPTLYPLSYGGNLLAKTNFVIVP